MIKQIQLTFLVSFVLNLVWENLHSLLYDNYMGGRVSEFVLLWATIADAVMIMIITLPFVIFKNWKERSWLILPIGFFIGAVIERFALSTSRWAYNEYMPIVPFISVGLTPLIQLGILGYTSYKLGEKFSKAKT